MRHPRFACALLLLVLSCGGDSTSAVPDGGAADASAVVPDGATAALVESVSVTTLVTFPYQTEGLTGDADGNLYTAARNPGVNVPCPVYKTKLASPAVTIVGYIPPPSETGQCATFGLAFNAAGDLFVTSSGTGAIYKLTPSETSPPTATVFATDVPGANGVAFDKAGNLWVSDGTTGQGRVWKVSPSGGPGVEQFRVQPMRNSVALVGSNLFPDGMIPADGIGRQIRSFLPGTLMDSATSGGDAIVANGLAFDSKGDLWIADTARGAIWRVQLAAGGGLASPVGCDTTFAADTLCLSNVFVAHPMLEAIDGIALDAAGNVWGVANGRQAIVVVSRADRNVREVFRNPVNGTTGLRNAGDQSIGNNHVLEFPASPFLLGDKLCTSSFDSAPPGARDNAPASGGEIDPAGAMKGKISCSDQPLTIAGLPLPVH